jgi:catechol 2,3-dioxygenase-like lactoylglutathione lyase family enzyme
MKVSEGVTWVITCTPEFERTVAFFRDIMGLSLAEEGVPVTDTQFTRYALMRLPHGATLEIVEPADEAVGALYAAPVVCFKVDDLTQARHDLAGNGAEFVAPIFRAQDHMSWTYFRAPDGHVYQIWDEAPIPDQGDTSTQQ